MISSQESRTRGLILHGLSSLMGEVARGVIKSNSRVKNSVLAHEKEEEKKLNAAWGETQKAKKRNGDQRQEGQRKGRKGQRRNRTSKERDGCQRQHLVRHHPEMFNVLL